MTKRTDLEGKLRAIQELKGEKYIGTQDAYKYITRVANLYDNPKKIADAINTQLATQGPVLYPATPERIMGLGRTFSKLIRGSDWHQMNFLHDNTPDQYDSRWEEAFEKEDALKESEHPLNNLIELITGHTYLGDEKILKAQPAVVRDYFFNLFNQFQNPEANDETFGFESMQKGLEEVPLTQIQTDFINSKIPSLNWNYLLSKENLREIERTVKREAYIENIDINERIKRIKNDRVDHQLEQRREILTDWLTHGEYTSYEEAIKVLDYQFSEAKRRHASIMRTSGNNLPNDILKQSLGVVQKYEFLRRILGADKNFVIKFLRS